MHTMKKIINFLFGLMVIANLVFFGLIAIFQLKKPKPIPTPTPIPQEQVLGLPKAHARNSANIFFNQHEYEIYWHVINNPSNIFLRSNLADQQSASILRQQQKCNFLINAGFYSKELTHIGLFIENYHEISHFQNNALLNGILSLNTFDTPRITKIVPEDELVFALQTGPVLIYNAVPQVLNIKNDHSARRSIAAVTGSNKLIFIIIFQKNSDFEGPLLTNLPEIIAQFNNSQELNIADAVNLDGGSASAYFDQDFSFPELNTIGGYFCEFSSN